MRLTRRLEEFEKTWLFRWVGCSVDSPYSHLAWLNTPISKGGIEGIDYPLIADMNKQVTKDYEVLFEEEGVSLSWTLFNR